MPNVLSKLHLTVTCGLPQTKRGDSWALSISKEVTIHLVLDYPSARCVAFIPEETQEVSVLWMDVKGMKYLFNVTHDSCCLPSKSK